MSQTKGKQEKAQEEKKPAAKAGAKSSAAKKTTAPKAATEIAEKKAPAKRAAKKPEESAAPKAGKAPKPAKAVEPVAEMVQPIMEPAMPPVSAPAAAALKVLFIASEAQPFIASGGLADVAGSLPKALIDEGVDCRVVIPLYSDIKPALRESLHFLTSFEVDLSWRKQYCGIFEAIENGVTYYLIDNEYYFKRPGLYGYFDDAERFAYFSKAVLEMLRHIDFEPDVLNANDWQTALVPLYLNLFYRGVAGLKRVKTVFTIHNIQYQGMYGMELLGDVLGVDKRDGRFLEYGAALNFMKAAIEMSDRVTTVSPTYAQEILDPWFSHGLDGFLQARRFKLSGILNGLDTDMYNPATDPLIYECYDGNTLDKKAANKEALLRELSMQPMENTPLIGVVSRLVAHKGLDLIKYVFEDMLRVGTQVVVLGSGEHMYEEFFRNMQDKYPQNVRFIAGFIPALAHKIYAGADMFLMPSKSEPCGLAQMIAARYGTAPIVRETGGLKDTIRDFGSVDGNGFTFKTYNAHDMLGAVERARGCYLNKEAWVTLQKAAMTSDFTWGKSAKAYKDLYQSI